MFDSFVFKIFFQSVGNIAFCNTAEIDPGFRICESYCVAIHIDAMIINMFDCRCQFIGIGKCFLFIVRKVPQFCCRSDSDIEPTAWNISVSYSFLYKSGCFIGNRYRFSSRVVYLWNFTRINRCAKHLFIIFTHLQTVFHDFLISSPRFNLNDRIEICSGYSERFALWRCCASGKCDDQYKNSCHADST